MKILRKLALAGNILLILWVLYNGIDEGLGHSATLRAAVIPLTLAALLIVDSVLLW